MCSGEQKYSRENKNVLWRAKCLLDEILRLTSTPGVTVIVVPPQRGYFLTNSSVRNSSPRIHPGSCWVRQTTEYGACFSVTNSCFAGALTADAEGASAAGAAGVPVGRAAQERRPGATGAPAARVPVAPLGQAARDRAAQEPRHTASTTAP